MLLKKRLLCGILAVTTAMTTIAFTASYSYANPGVRRTSSVVKNVRKVPFTLSKIRLPKRPPNILQWNRRYRQLCAKLPKAPTCNR